MRALASPKPPTHVDQCFSRWAASSILAQAAPLGVSLHRPTNVRSIVRDAYQTAAFPKQQTLKRLRPNLRAN
jgi:hypothetical protein